MSDPTATRTVTAGQAKAAILHCFHKQRPVFLTGPIGIGKSELAQTIANEMGGLLIDLRMATFEPTDIRGIPYFNKELGVMSWAPPVELPSEELAAQYPIVLLFLDEMNSAAPSVQAAAYQLILNRRVGTYSLPKNVVIMAAGNRESDKGVTYRMPAPLANRFIHLEMRVDYDSWLTWAVEHRIHKDVVGFITFSKKSLFNFDARGASKAFATPRTWTFVSELLDDDMASTQVLTDLVAGAIGEGTALEFMTHRRNAGALPNPADILAGKAPALATKEISAMYSLVTSLCYELNDWNKKSTTPKERDMWYEMADNFLAYLMANMNTELNVMAARVAVSTFNLPFAPSRMKVFTEFQKKYGKLILAATNGQ